jgi:hypothetical protein
LTYKNLLRISQNLKLRKPVLKYYYFNVILNVGILIPVDAGGWNPTPKMGEKGKEEIC